MVGLLLFSISNCQGIFSVRNVHTGPPSLSSLSEKTRCSILPTLGSGALRPEVNTEPQGHSAPPGVGACGYQIYSRNGLIRKIPAHPERGFEPETSTKKASRRDQLSTHIATDLRVSPKLSPRRVSIPGLDRPRLICCRVLYRLS